MPGRRVPGPSSPARCAGAAVRVPVPGTAQRADLRDAGLERCPVRVSRRSLRAVSPPGPGRRRVGMRGDGRRRRLPLAVGGRRRSAGRAGRRVRVRRSHGARRADLCRPLAGSSAARRLVELSRRSRPRLRGARLHPVAGASHRRPMRVRRRLPRRQRVHRWPLPAGSTGAGVLVRPGLWPGEALSLRELP
jgi:hypothetical protein